MKKRFWKSIAAGLLAILLIVGTAAAAGVPLLDPEPSTWTFYVDGEKIDLKGVEFEGFNYLKLRDLLKALDMNVEYDGAKRTVMIDTSAAYVDPFAPAPTPVKNDVPWKEVTVGKDDPTYYNELLLAEAYNFRISRLLPTAFTKDSWDALQTAAGVGNILALDPDNLTDANKAALDAVLAARKALVQVKPYSDGSINGAVIYLWGDSMPDTTNPEESRFAYTERNSFDNSNIQDNADFRPFITPYLAEDQDNVKGTIITVSGGAFVTRSVLNEGFNVAPAFQALGYNVFDLQYRVSPWSTTECALDLQRAIRVVKNVVAENNLKGGDILGVAGFSAGGMNVINVISKYYGDITPNQFDETYVCDKIDTGYTSDFDVAMLIYGVGGMGEGGGELDTKNPKIPHLFIAMAEDDALVNPSKGLDLWLQAYKNENGQFTDVNPELHVYAQNVHGFGPGKAKTSSELWIPSADKYIQEVMGKNFVYVDTELPDDLENAEEFTLEARYVRNYNGQLVPLRVLVDKDFTRYLFVYYMYAADTFVAGKLIDNGDGTYTPADPTYGPASLSYIIKFGDHLAMWNGLKGDMSQFKPVTSW